MAAFVCFILMGTFGALYICALLCSDTALGLLRRFSVAEKKKKIFVLAVTGAALLSGAVFTALILSRNRFVYCWDYGDYWTRSFRQAHYMFSDPAGCLKGLITSVRYDEYNLLLPTLISLPLHLFGYSFESYVLCCYVFFLAPAFLLQALACLAALRSDPTAECGTVHWILALFAAMLMPVSWFALFRGYIDAGCLVPASFMLLAAMEWKPDSLGRRQILRDILMAAMMLAAFAGRRYFAYYGVGTGAALAAVSLVFVLRAGKEGTAGQALFKAAINLCITGGFLIVSLLAFLRPLVNRVLHGGYARQYEAYDLPFGLKLAGFAGRFGLLCIICAAAAPAADVYFMTSGRAGALRSGNGRTVLSIRTLAAGVLCIVTAAAFSTVQAFGIHHLYLAVCPVLVLDFAFAGRVTDYFGRNRRHKERRRTAAAVLAGLWLLNFLVCYLPLGDDNLSYTEDYTPDAVPGFFAKRYCPLARNDIDELRRLFGDLESCAGGAGGQMRQVYVLGGSFILNTDLIRSINKPDVDDEYSWLLPAADVDLRDGFSPYLLEADYVVTSDPVQTYLPEGTQDVIAYPALLIRDSGSTLGRHYKKLPGVYSLDGAVAEIYEKISDPDSDALEELAQYYDRKYPGMDYLFRERITDER